MAALDFPNSPTVGQIYNGTNGVTYTWDGTVWTVPLGGMDLWVVSGATLTPTDTTKIVAIPATPTAVTFGNRTIKGRLVQNPVGDTDYLTCNATLNAGATAWVQDDVSKASWGVMASAAADLFQVQRVAPGTVTGTALLSLDSTGTLTLPRQGGGDAITCSGAGQKGHIGLTTSPSFAMRLNANLAGTATDDAVQPSWTLQLDIGDSLSVWRAPPTAGAPAFSNLLNLSNVGNLTILGPTATKQTGTTWANPSDERMKRNVANYDAGLDAITQLRPVCFKYNGEFGSIDNDILCYGYIAQEVEQVMPECVGEMQWEPAVTQEGVTKPAPVTLKTLDTSNILLALVNAVKELATRVAVLEAA
ncbi:MAG TPA: tail fiber domain-containing protein [Vicinamibacterales bacterium]|nr:tail fiber domain-containing protein [Vicinamibacterales bacterium]